MKAFATPPAPDPQAVVPDSATNGEHAFCSTWMYAAVMLQNFKFLVMGPICYFANFVSIDPPKLGYASCSKSDLHMNGGRLT